MSNPYHVIGIDPGLHGGWAVLRIESSLIDLAVEAFSSNTRGFNQLPFAEVRDGIRIVDQGELSAKKLTPPWRGRLDCWGLEFKSMFKDPRRWDNWQVFLEKPMPQIPNRSRQSVATSASIYQLHRMECRYGFLRWAIPIQPPRWQAKMLFKAKGSTKARAWDAFWRLFQVDEHTPDRPSDGIVDAALIALYGALYKLPWIIGLGEEGWKEWRNTQNP